MDRRKDVVTMSGSPMTLLGKEIKIGDAAPDFTAIKSDMKPYSLKDAGDSVKIISVVTSLDTGLCEMQTIKFNEEASELENVVILTLSVDLPFAQRRFCSANNIDKVITLSDHRDLDFGLKYGFVMEEVRLLSRGIVVLDKNNKVVYVEYVDQVGKHPDYDKALEAVKNI
ncbi:MAG: thiol peroxidase [Clostridia bacterium]|nr:thiol peroxidase [Clostridia bacterium]